MALSEADLQKLRLNCYIDIEALRKRPLIIYAAQFINIPFDLQGTPISIEIGDIEGFTDLINTSDGSDSVDVNRFFET